MMTRSKELTEKSAKDSLHYPKKGYLGLELNDKLLHVDGWLGGKAIDEYKRFCHEVDKRFVNDGLSFHVRQSTTFVDKGG